MALGVCQTLLKDALLYGAGGGESILAMNTNMAVWTSTLYEANFIRKVLIQHSLSFCLILKP